MRKDQSVNTHSPPLVYRGSATERVKEFVRAEAEKLPAGTHQRMPSMRSLSAHLGVSVATIQTAFRQLNTEGIIHSQPNRASFIRAIPKKSEKRIYHIGIDFLYGDEEANISWRTSLYGGLFQRALNPANQIVFHSIPTDDLTLSDLFIKDLDCGLDGMILAKPKNIIRWNDLGASIPAVFHPQITPEMTENFVAADLYQASFLVGRAFAAVRRKRPSVTTHSHFRDSDFNWLIPGLTAGFCSEGTPYSTIGVLNLGFDEEEEFKILESVYRKPQTAPDAILCSSDHTAMSILKSFKRLGINVPEQVAVVGGTGLVLMHTEFFTMTRIFQPFTQIGMELVARLVAAIDSEDPVAVRRPGVFIPCHFGGGETTLAGENEILGIHKQNKKNG